MENGEAPTPKQPEPLYVKPDKAAQVPEAVTRLYTPKDDPFTPRQSNLEVLQEEVNRRDFLQRLAIAGASLGGELGALFGLGGRRKQEAVAKQSEPPTISSQSSEPQIKP